MPISIQFHTFLEHICLLFNVVFTLDILDVFQDSLVFQNNFGVAEAQLCVFRKSFYIIKGDLCVFFRYPDIPDILNPADVRLTGKDIDDAVDGVGLILLDFEIKLQLPRLPPEVWGAKS